MGPWWEQAYPSANASRTNPVVLTPMAVMPFKWLVSGDYSPTIQIQFFNSSSVLQYTYEEIKIHVASLVDIQNQKLEIQNQKIAVQDENLNTVNVILTVALVIVAVVESIRMFEEALEKVKGETQQPSSANASDTNPKTNITAAPM